MLCRSFHQACSSQVITWRLAVLVSNGTSGHRNIDESGAIRFFQTTKVNHEFLSLRRMCL